jgi:hypothetical protein
MATGIDTSEIVYIVATTCGACGIVFGLPTEFRKKRVADGQLFYCPNGHHIGWSKSEDPAVKELRAKLASETTRRERAETDAQWQRQQRLVVDRQNRARKGVITRIKNRVKHGVCPCCNRTFQNLGRHMEGQHPDWSPEKLPTGRPRASEVAE